MSLFTKNWKLFPIWTPSKFHVNNDSHIKESHTLFGQKWNQINRHKYMIECADILWHVWISAQTKQRISRLLPWFIAPSFSSSFISSTVLFPYIFIYLTFFKLLVPSGLVSKSRLSKFHNRIQTTGGIPKRSSLLFPTF